MSQKPITFLTYVVCPSCGETSYVSLAVKLDESKHIVPDDGTIYFCSHCGYKWSTDVYACPHELVDLDDKTMEVFCRGCKEVFISKEAWVDKVYGHRGE